MDKEASEYLFRMLAECRQLGFVGVTKDSSNELRLAINEAKSRDWIRKRNGYSYELTPLGMEVLDFDSIDEYLIHKKETKQQPIINANNVVYGDNHGSINQSSSDSLLDIIQKKIPATMAASKLGKWLGSIILGIITWLIIEYILIPLFL